MFVTIRLRQINFASLFFAESETINIDGRGSKVFAKVDALKQSSSSYPSKSFSHELETSIVPKENLN